MFQSFLARKLLAHNWSMCKRRGGIHRGEIPPDPGRGHEPTRGGGRARPFADDGAHLRHIAIGAGVTWPLWADMDDAAIEPLMHRKRSAAAPAFVFSHNSAPRGQRRPSRLSSTVLHPFAAREAPQTVPRSRVAPERR